MSLRYGFTVKEGLFWDRRHEFVTACNVNVSSQTGSKRAGVCLRSGVFAAVTSDCWFWDGNCRRYRSGGELEPVPDTHTNQRQEKNVPSPSVPRTTGAPRGSATGGTRSWQLTNKLCCYREHKAQYCNYRVAPKQYAKEHAVEAMA